MNIETSEPDNLARLLLWERCNHIMDGKLKQAPDHDVQVKMELLDVINHAKHANFVCFLEVQKSVLI